MCFAYICNENIYNVEIAHAIGSGWLNDSEISKNVDLNNAKEQYYYHEF